MTPAMTAHRAQLARELRDEEAARLWSMGGVRRDRLERVRASIPTAGHVMADWCLYPTWEQLVELAHLCFVEPLWFVEE